MCKNVKIVNIYGFISDFEAFNAYFIVVDSKYESTIDGAQTKVMIKMQTCKHDPHPHPFVMWLLKKH
jgi:hypothetical protein